MAKDYIGYETLTDDALRGVVRAALRKVTAGGLVGAHQFYITFKTHDPGVDLPDFLQERYPDEMTIVLQNQFWDLTIDEDKFSVTLNFQKLPATLVVPFAALTAFADPGVKWGVQFRNATPREAAEKTAGGAQAAASPAPEAAGDANAASAAEAQIVSLDQFRKK